MAATTLATEVPFERARMVWELPASAITDAATSPTASAGVRSGLWATATVLSRNRLASCRSSSKACSRGCSIRILTIRRCRASDSNLETVGRE